MLYCVLKLCTVISTLRWAVLTVLWIGFCHTGPTSLCVDLFVFICVYFLFFVNCMCFAAKRSERFPAHLNNVSTLPCETWNVHPTRATVELLQKETAEFMPPQLCPENESSWLQRVRTTAREGVHNTHHWSGRTETATESGVGQAWSCRHCGRHLSVVSLIAPKQWCRFCTPCLAIFPTCSYQLDSNLANLEATVEVGKILELLFITTQR